MSAQESSILKSTTVMTMATLLSRASGLLRTWAMAFALGNTFLTSAYQVANNMPNVIYDLVAGGILGTAFLPVYLLQKERLGRFGSDRFASNILNISLVVLGLLAVVATVFAPAVIATQTFTLEGEALVSLVAVDFFRIFAIQLVFYGLGGVITGVLNANRVYGLPALAPAINNIVVVISMFSYVPLAGIDPSLAITVLGIGTSLGVVAQFAIQIPALVKSGFIYVPRINLRDPALKEALRIAAPTLIYIVGTLVSFSCRNAFSLETGEDGPSTLLFAWTWYQLPYGVVAVSLSTAFLTEMSDCVARKDLDGLRVHIKQGLSTTLFLIIPLAAIMIALAAPIIQIFRAGEFTQDDVGYVSLVLAAWLTSLPFYAGQMFLYRVFAALRQFMAFALVSCGLCIIQVGLYALLCSNGAFGLGLLGVPVADFVYYALQFVVMAFILKRRVGHFGMPEVVRTGLKMLGASAVAVAAVMGLLLLFPLQQSIVASLGGLVLLGSVGLLLAFLVGRLLRVPEMDSAFALLRKLADRLPALERLMSLLPWRRQAKEGNAGSKALQGIAWGKGSAATGVAATGAAGAAGFAGAAGAAIAGTATTNSWGKGARRAPGGNASPARSHAMNASRSLSQSALETPRGKHARVEMVPVSPALGGQALRTRSAAQGPLRERARFTGEETWQKVGKHARMPLDDKAMAAMAEPAGQTAHRRGALPLPKPVPLPGANEGASEAKAGLPFANGGFPAARVSPPNANGALPVANGDLPAANGTSHHDDQVYSDPGTTIYSDPGATGAIMARAKHL